MRRSIRTTGLAAAACLLLAACVQQGASDNATVAFIPGYQSGGTEAAAPPQGYSDPSRTGTVIGVTLNDTSSTQMSITLSQPSAPAGEVSFIITNASTTMKHELVGFQTKTLAADYPITGFEGDPNRIDEDTAGKVVIDTGAALKPGAQQMLTVKMAEGHYALVCNLSGHYAAGMHVDFWVTPLVS